MASLREFVPHHRDEGVSATCSALSHCCLLPLCCAARTPRTPHAALALLLLLLVPRTHRATKPRHQTPYTNDDARRRKDAACPYGHKAEDADRWGTWILGGRPGNGAPLRARVPAFSPPMRAWLEQPHGRRHKAPPQPCALTTTISTTCISTMNYWTDLFVLFTGFPPSPKVRTFTQILFIYSTKCSSHFSDMQDYATFSHFLPVKVKKMAIFISLCTFTSFFFILRAYFT